MYKLGIIEESLKERKILDMLKPYFVSQRIENVPEDEFPIWHINEYHVSADKMDEILDMLKEKIKVTWYSHAFNAEKLYVVFSGKYFTISPEKDQTWNDMMEYGASVAKVERSFLETIPLHI